MGEGQLVFPCSRRMKRLVNEGFEHLDRSGLKIGNHAAKVDDNGIQNKLPGSNLQGLVILSTMERFQNGLALKARIASGFPGMINESAKTGLLFPSERNVLAHLRARARAATSFPIRTFVGSGTTTFPFRGRSFGHLAPKGGMIGLNNL